MNLGLIIDGHQQLAKKLFTSFVELYLIITMISTEMYMLEIKKQTAICRQG